jgi:hypothetical protein
MSDLSEKILPTPSGSNNSMSTTPTTTTLTPVTLNSIDSLTISYLKGEISFQQYESMIENQHFQNELMLNQLNAVQMDRLLFTAENVQIDNTVELNAFDPLSDNPFSFSNQETTTKQKLSKKRTKTGNNIDSNNESSQSSSPIKKPKLKDRFLNMKDIMNDKDLLGDDFEAEIENEDSSNENEAENEGEDEDDEYEDEDEDDDMIDDIDETSNWNDFDIETLNFDKFIKDHQISNKTKLSAESTGYSAPDQNEQATNKSYSSANKRKNKEEKIVDQVELKAKRRVNSNTND